jgi:hypothetical protein
VASAQEDALRSLHISVVRHDTSVVPIRSVSDTFVVWEAPLKTNRVASHFRTMDLKAVPRSRNGKHKAIVSLIIRDLDQLKDGGALRVPLAELGDTKENVRSALNRATRNAKRNVATATDENFLYVWNVSKT